MDEALKKFLQEVESLFPRIRVNNWGYGIDVHVGYGTSNFALKDSEYFLDTAGKQFFHLTTYKNLFSIMNSGVLRLYNLRNSNDPNELEYYKDGGLSADQVFYHKESVHTFSFCHVADIANVDLWREYGKVAIVFEIINDPKSWEYFRLAPIQYKTNPSFQKYFELANEYSKHYGMPFNHDSIVDLIAFHKMEKFKHEKEVRLVYRVPSWSRDMDLCPDFKISEHHTGFTRYAQLGLHVEPEKNGHWRNIEVKRLAVNEEIYFADRPKIIIKKVVFGDNEEFLDQDTFRRIRNGFQSYFFERFGYDVEVERELFKTGVGILGK